MCFWLGEEEAAGRAPPLLVLFERKGVSGWILREEGLDSKSGGTVSSLWKGEREQRDAHLTSGIPGRRLGGQCGLDRPRCC